MILIGGIFAEASNIISGKEEKKISIGKEDNFNCRFRFFEKIKKINIVISNKIQVNVLSRYLKLFIVFK